MSTLLPIPTDKTDPEGRLQRVQALRDNQLFQVLFHAKVMEKKEKTAAQILSGTTPDATVHDLRVEYATLCWVADILDSEERAAKAAASEHNHNQRK